MHLLLARHVALSLCCALHSSYRAPPPRAAELVDADDVAMRLSEGEVALIDVRQPAEYRLDGRVDGSINIAAYSWEHGFHVPLDDFAATVSEEGFEVDAPIALIHSMPMLATGAAQVLEAAGFTDVSIVEGGLQSWEPEALIVDDDEGLVGSWV